MKNVALLLVLVFFASNFCVTLNSNCFVKITGTLTRNNFQHAHAIYRAHCRSQLSHVYPCNKAFCIKRSLLPFTFTCAQISFASYSFRSSKNDDDEETKKMRRAKRLKVNI